MSSYLLSKISSAFLLMSFNLFKTVDELARVTAVYETLRVGLRVADSFDGMSAVFCYV